MASSPLRLKSHRHARSVSLPSRSHPLIPLVDEHLCRIKASEAASSPVGERLSILLDMYSCLDDLLLLPHTQEALAKQNREKWVEVVLDGYLNLLDVCGTAKDVSSQAKQDAQDLLSIIRRKRDANELGGYSASRKRVKKLIQKSLRDLKNIRSKHTILASDKYHETMAICALLNDVEAATLAVMESLLSYMAGAKAQSRFSLVSKLLHSKTVEAQDEETGTNEFDKVDIALCLLSGHKSSRSSGAMSLENLQIDLQRMEMSIQELEGGLECLFRRLIKTRVSLLNILNH
ncbi:uncharacterized protein LOC127802194 [Diospyros lotus]|uniref:uncharacterized protein LOC127802194 n=1 Tax=Diospyros lotus TaxID=55363 RepID=UPI002252DA18|nr:uncharacterized protein LOC127802194 [Diospyros lotus]